MIKIYKLLILINIVSISFFLLLEMTGSSFFYVDSMRLFNLVFFVFIIISQLPALLQDIKIPRIKVRRKPKEPVEEKEEELDYNLDNYTR